MKFAWSCINAHLDAQYIFIRLLYIVRFSLSMPRNRNIIIVISELLFSRARQPRYGGLCVCCSLGVEGRQRSIIGRAIRRQKQNRPWLTTRNPGLSQNPTTLYLYYTVIIQYYTIRHCFKYAR